MKVLILVCASNMMGAPALLIIIKEFEDLGPFHFHCNNVHIKYSNGLEVPTSRAHENEGIKVS